MSKANVIVVNKDLCQACGRCAMACFRGAISLESGRAEIFQSRCNGCGLCINACTQGAIGVVGQEPVSVPELADQVSAMKSRTDNILRRIGALKRK